MSEQKCADRCPSNSEMLCDYPLGHQSSHHFNQSTGEEWPNAEYTVPLTKAGGHRKLREIHHRWSEHLSAEADRDNAMQQVSDNTNAEWRNYVTNLIESRLDEVFTADDVWERIKVENTPYGVHDPRALGPVLVALQRRGVIVWTGEYRASVRRHLAPIKEWRRVTPQLSS